MLWVPKNPTNQGLRKQIENKGPTPYLNKIGIQTQSKTTHADPHILRLQTTPALPPYTNQNLRLNHKQEGTRACTKTSINVGSCVASNGPFGHHINTLATTSVPTRHEQTCTVSHLVPFHIVNNPKRVISPSGTPCAKYASLKENRRTTLVRLYYIVNQIQNKQHIRERKSQDCTLNVDRMNNICTHTMVFIRSIKQCNVMKT